MQNSRTAPTCRCRIRRWGDGRAAEAPRRIDSYKPRRRRSRQVVRGSRTIAFPPELQRHTSVRSTVRSHPCRGGYVWPACSMNHCGGPPAFRRAYASSLPRADASQRLGGQGFLHRSRVWVRNQAQAPRRARGHKTGRPKRQAALPPSLPIFPDKRTRYRLPIAPKKRTAKWRHPPSFFSHETLELIAQDFMTAQRHHGPCLTKSGQSRPSARRELARPVQSSRKVPEFRQVARIVNRVRRGGVVLAACMSKVRSQPAARQVPRSPRQQSAGAIQQDQRLAKSLPSPRVPRASPARCAPALE